METGGTLAVSAVVLVILACAGLAWYRKERNTESRIRPLPKDSILVGPAANGEPQDWKKQTETNQTASAMIMSMLTLPRRTGPGGARGSAVIRGSTIPRGSVDMMAIQIDKDHVVNMSRKPVRDQIAFLLRSVPIFQDLIDLDTLTAIADRCHLRRFEEGEHVVRQDTEGDSMYMIKSGRVSVTQSCLTEQVLLSQGPAHIELAQLGPHDFFGEMSLLVGDNRSATVTASSFLECVEVPKEALLSVLVSQPQIALNIAQVVTDRKQELNYSQRQQHALSLSRSINDHFDSHSLLALLRKVPVFSPLSEDEEVLRGLAARSRLETFKAGETIVKQGETDESSSMFIIKKGTVSVSISFTHCDSGITMNDVEIAQLGEGDFFGEMSLLVGEPRSATVSAIDDTECMRISKQALLPVLIARADLGPRIAQQVTERQQQLSKTSTASSANGDGKSDTKMQDLSASIGKHFEVNELISLLKRVPILEEVVKQEQLLRSLASRCLFETFEEGHRIVSQNEKGNSMYIVRSGSLVVSIETGRGTNSEVAVLGAGDFFGEMSLLTGEARSANVTATCSCNCIRVPQAALLPVLVAWPTLTVNIARIVTERRQQLPTSQKMGDLAPVKQVSVTQLSESIEKHFDAGAQVELLRSVSVFSSLLQDESLMRLLASKCRLKRFKSQSCIVRQHDKTDQSMYVIKSGRVHVFFENQPRSQARASNTTRRWSITDMVNGSDTSYSEIAILQPNDFFGEMALLTGEARCCSVVAQTPCECLEIPKAALLPLLLTRPQLCFLVAEVVTERRQRLSKGQRKMHKAANYLSERIDHFFRVDQVLRQHTNMLESQAITEMRTLMW